MKKTLAILVITLLVGSLVFSATAETAVEQLLNKTWRATDYAKVVENVPISSSLRDASAFLGNNPLYWDRVRVADGKYQGNANCSWFILHNISYAGVKVEVPHPFLFRFTAEEDGGEFNFIATRDPYTMGQGWKEYKSNPDEGSISMDPYLSALSGTVREDSRARVGLFLDGPVGVVATVSMLTATGELTSTMNVQLTPLAYENGGSTFVLGESSSYVYGTELGLPDWAAAKPVASQPGSATNQIVTIQPDYDGFISVIVENLPEGAQCHFWYGDVVIVDDVAE